MKKLINLENVVVTEEVVTVVSKADRKGEELLETKSRNVAELMKMWIEKHKADLHIKLGAKNKAGELRARDLKGEHYLFSFCAMSEDQRQLMIKPILKYIMVNALEGKTPVQQNSILSAVSMPLAELVRTGFVKSWKSRKVLRKDGKQAAIKTDIVGQYATVAVEVADALLEVMIKMGLVFQSLAPTTKGTETNMIQGIDENTIILSDEKNLAKYLEKEVSPMFMDYYPSYWEYGQVRNKLGYSLYCGSSKKYNQRAQPEHIYDYANKIIGTGYTLVEELCDMTHPAGKRFTQLMHAQLGHASQIDRYDSFLEEYQGESLYPRVQFVPDNGRDYILGVHSGAMFWLYEFEEAHILTPEEGARLATRIADLEAKGKLKVKEECELLHYMVAYQRFLAGKPTGCQVTRDFKGSGPMCQAILTKNLEQLKMSIDYNGGKAKDPYNSTLKAMDHKIVQHWTEVLHTRGQNGHQIGVTLRNWMKGLAQPVQYGGGESTAQDSSFANYGNEILFADFKPAFDKALPATKIVLDKIKGWAKTLSKEIGNGSEGLNRLDYTTAGGFLATITPLSKDFKHTFTSFGRTREVPMKIVDLDEHSVKTAAAGSHQLDAAIKMMLVLLTDAKVGPVHDDFRVQLRDEEDLTQKAIDTILYFWNKEDLFDNYLRQVFSGLESKYGYRAGHKVTEVPELDPKLIDTILFS